MNVTFINKPFFIEPLGIMYLMSALKKAGHNVNLMLTTDNGAEIIDSRPDMVCYSIMTGDQAMYNEINTWMKAHAKASITIAGGPHPTFFPEMIQQKETSFDAVCVGEGEEAIVEIANGASIHETKNISTKEATNPVRPLIKNLDTISFPSRDEVFSLPVVKNGPIKHFIAGRGCPYNCSYCFNKAYSEIYKGDKRVRFRSVDNLLDEIEEVIGQSPETKVIYFQDDTFILDRKWLTEFAIKYSQRCGLPYHCHCRANLVNEDIVQLLTGSNCISVHLAAESGNQAVREKLLNRKMTDKMIEDACKLFRKYDIKVMLQNMIGLPGTTWENDLETLELNIRCKPDYSWVSIFHPYPKTQLGEYAVEIGEYKGDFSDLSSNFFDKTPLQLSHANKIENLQKLFAFVVQNPKIYDTKLLHHLVNTEDEEVKKSFAEIYKSTRKESDQILYGVKL